MIFLFIFSTLILHSSAWAWDQHQTMMEQILDTPAAQKRDYLSTEVKVPCLVEEKETVHQIATELLLNEARIPVGSRACTQVVSVATLLGSDFVDEPDQGMDQDLPESADPTHARPWMGGTTGFSSQGFRHMYFAGWEWTSPLRTLQIPFHAVGEAPVRFEKMRVLSERFFSQGNLYWGIRTLMWSLHYLQDLQQPFHVIQIPYFRMLPWHSLFNGFVQRSTRFIGNYHFGYEGLVLEYVKEAELISFQNCFLEEPHLDSTVDIFKVIEGTRAYGEKVGKPIYGLFSSTMEDPEVDLPNGKGDLDYYALVHAKENGVPPKDEAKELSDEELKRLKNQDERVENLKMLKSVTCELMKSLASNTWSEIDRAFQTGSVNSSKTGK